MKEEDIRPRAIFDEYLALARADIPRFFADRGGFVDVPCPGCAGRAADEAFEKDGFAYVKCRRCGSLYVSPRPDAPAIWRFYGEAPSNRFFAERFNAITEPLRLDTVYRPRARMVADLLAQTRAGGLIVDVGAGRGIFCAELIRLGCAVRAVEPSPAHADACRANGVPVVQRPVESVDGEVGGATIVTSFELIEHVFSTDDFVGACAALLAPGGLLVLTTLNAEGFDLRLLGRHSRSISPPHHLNFLSPAGMAMLLERHRLQVVSLTTPGRLDVDIVCRHFRDRGEAPQEPFLRRLVDGDDDMRESFQQFLANNGLSSHMRAVGRAATL
jgi:SAM-dependent methyltransferase